MTIQSGFATSQQCSPSSLPSVLSANGFVMQCDGVDDAPAVRHKVGDRHDQLAESRSVMKRRLGQLEQTGANEKSRLLSIVL